MIILAEAVVGENRRKKDDLKIVIPFCLKIFIRFFLQLRLFKSLLNSTVVFLCLCKKFSENSTAVKLSKTVWKRSVLRPTEQK